MQLFLSGRIKNPLKADRCPRKHRFRLIIGRVVHAGGVINCPHGKPSQHLPVQVASHGYRAARVVIMIIQRNIYLVRRRKGQGVTLRFGRLDIKTSRQVEPPCGGKRKINGSGDSFRRALSGRRVRRGVCAAVIHHNGQRLPRNKPEIQRSYKNDRSSKSSRHFNMTAGESAK